MQNNIVGPEKVEADASKPLEHPQDKHKKVNKKKRLVIIGVVVLAVIILGGIFALTKGKKSNSVATGSGSQEKGPLDASTGYTGIKADVLTNQTFDCAPRNENEWYRTDHTLVVDNKDPNVMYVNVEWKGLFKTTDGGKTWTQKVKGIKVYARNDDKTKGCYSEYPALRLDPKDNKHLVLAVSSGGGGFLDATTANSQVGGVYQSFDAGETWQLMINNKMNTYVTDVRIDQTNPQNVYYGTTSNPGSWQEADQNKLFVTKGLIYKTTDTGKTWEELPTGIGQRSGASSVLLNPKDSNEITAPTYSAVRQSADGTGTGVSTGKDTSAVAQLGILHSLDGGKTWTKTIELPGNPAILQGFVSPTNYQHMYFTPSSGTSSSPVGYVVVDGKTPRTTKYMDVVAYDPYDTSGKHVLGFTTVSVGPNNQNLVLWESIDGGNTWQKHGTLPKEITDPNSTKTRVSNIVWSPTESKTIYMSGSGGHVWKSSDLGQTWTTLLDYTKLPN